MNATQEQQLFKALSDPLRRRLLCLLSERASCVGDLVTVLGVPQPTASRHLAHLRRAGWVEARQQGLWTFYSLAKPTGPLHEQLLSCLTLAGQTGSEHVADARQAEALRAHGGCCPYDDPASSCQAPPSAAAAKPPRPPAQC